MTTELLLAVLILAGWVGLIALQLADVVITASRLPQLSAFSNIKAELLEAEGTRISPEQLDAWRAQVAELDAREAARAIPAGRGATEQLWRATPWRLAPTALAVAGLVLSWPLSLVALPLPIATYVLALAAARASVAAASARASIHEQQRAEIDELIDRASRSARKRVAGLGDRVNRALQILREQQS